MTAVNPWRDWARRLVEKEGRTVAFRAVLFGEQELYRMTHQPRPDWMALHERAHELTRQLVRFHPIIVDATRDAILRRLEAWDGGDDPFGDAARMYGENDHSLQHYALSRWIWLVQQ